MKMLTEGCGYTGSHFGANYIDAECFGGKLYDLDDGEDDELNEPSEHIPCPQCRPEEFAAWQKKREST